MTVNVSSISRNFATDATANQLRKLLKLQDKITSAFSSGPESIKEDNLNNAKDSIVFFSEQLLTDRPIIKPLSFLEMSSLFSLNFLKRIQEFV